MAQEIGDPDLYLSIKEAADVLRRLGFGPTTTRQVRRYADEGKLPFFRGPDGRRRISDQELRVHFRQLQRSACRRVGERD